MKTFFILLTTFFSVGLFAQTITIYGKATKNDGSRIKGTSMFKGYEDQLIVANYTGGSDNTATIEIEIPTSACVAEFRNMSNSTQPQTVVAKPTATATVKPSNAALAIPSDRINVKSLQTFPISKIEISVTNRTGNSMPTVARQIILEDVVVESCADIASSNTSKIKLKAKRIGWIYYNVDPKTGKPNGTNKSGWDNDAGAAWTSF